MFRSFRLGAILVLLLATFLLECCGPNSAKADTLPAMLETSTFSEDQLTVHTIQTDAHIRTYSVYFDGAPEGRPVVIALHGGGGNGSAMAMQANLVEKAKREGFVLVLPNGLGRKQGVGTWNAGGCCAYAARKKIDDVAFIQRVIGDVETKLQTDESRVYMFGISNGAMLAYRIAAKIPEGIAAVGTVVGATFADQTRPEVAVPMIMITAAQDEIVPSTGGMSPNRLVRRSQSEPFQSAESTAKFWAQANGCEETPQQTKMGAVIEMEYQGCVAPTVHLIIEDAGHAWPGGHAMRMEGATPSTALNATDVLWSFVNDKVRQ